MTSRHHLIGFSKKLGRQNLATVASESVLEIYIPLNRGNSYKTLLLQTLSVYCKYVIKQYLNISSTHIFLAREELFGNNLSIKKQ